MADGQSEDESPISEPAISNRANAIDLNIIAANAIVMNKDTDALLYQKKRHGQNCAGQYSKDDYGVDRA